MNGEVEAEGKGLLGG